MRLPETPRHAVGAAAADLAPKMMSESRREVFKHMATAAGASVAKATGPKPSERRVHPAHVRVEPSTRTLVAQLAGQLRTAAQDPAQRQAFERMRVAASSEPRAMVRKPA